MSPDVEQLARFFALSNDMLCIAGMDDGLFKRVNDAWSRTLGWTEDELLSKRYLDLVHPDDREATLSDTTGLAVGVTPVMFENRYRCRDGSFKWLQWMATAFTDERRIYAVVRDVTISRAGQSGLRGAPGEAAPASTAKNALLSRMSHELRTPLNAILGFAQLAELEGRLHADDAESLRQIRQGGQRLLALINEVLDIARIESGQVSLSMEAVTVVDVVQAAIDLVKPLAASRRVTIDHADLPFGDTAVLADRQRLCQILIHLLSNAIKFNRLSGNVSVRFEQVSPDRGRIMIADSGPGIPPAKLALLFQPFERLGVDQTVVEGSGLGLALSRALAHLMHGTLAVKSVVDHGSVFWVELRVAKHEMSRGVESTEQVVNRA